MASTELPSSTEVPSARSRVSRRVGKGWRAYRRWRRSRPFWAGLFTIAGGLELLTYTRVPMPIIIHAGISGISTLLMGALIVVMGLSMWIAPNYRVFASVATLLFSLASFLTSNFGGLLLGMLLGMVGGSLGCAWVRVAPESPDTEQDQSTPADGPADGPVDPAGATPEPAEQPLAASDPADLSTEQPEHPVQSAQSVPAKQATQEDEAQHTERGGGGGTTLPTLLLALVVTATALVVGPATRRPAAAADAPVVNLVVPSMTASSVDMTSLSFKGVVLVSTMDGPLRTLKFTMDAAVMRDYALTAAGAGRPAATLNYTVGTFTLRSNVAFYTTRMSGNLDGVGPVTFTPDAVPADVAADVRFTDFVSDQVFVRADTLTAKGLNSRSSNST